MTVECTEYHPHLGQSESSGGSDLSSGVTRLILVINLEVSWISKIVVVTSNSYRQKSLEGNILLEEDSPCGSLRLHLLVQQNVYGSEITEWSTVLEQRYF